jgi:hypothetical protein
MANMLTKAQSKMLKMNYYAVLNSRFLLYFIFFLAIVDLLFFSVAGEFGFIAVFILIGYLTSFFSKNMMVILTVAMVFTNIIRFGRDVRVEGMTMEEDELNEEFKEEFDDSDFEKYLEGGSGNAPAPAKAQAKAQANAKANAKAPAQAPAPVKAQVKAPAPIATSDFKAAGDSTLDNTNAVSNEDPSNKLAGLNAQTQSLLEKQQILLKNMDSLNPLLKKAESFMQQFQSTNP